MAYAKDGKPNYQETIKSVRDDMAALILDSIEKNPTSWERGWTAVDETTPINGSTNRAYNGFNSLYLYFVAQKYGYKDSRWVTFNQAKELGASVKKGEKSSPVLFYQLYDKNAKKEFNSLTVRDMSDDEKKQYVQENVRRVLKYSTVFNAEQCDRFPERKADLPKMSEEERAHQNAMIEKIIENSAAPVYYDGGNRAYYSPGTDSIHLPEVNAFHSMQDYYATALHEIAHSTGHESRLNRIGTYGSKESYAVEELRAELASIFMQKELGITLEGKHFENHAAYLNSWLNAVRSDKCLFFDAVHDAEKISDYIAEHYLQAELSADAEVQKEEQQIENTEEKFPVFDSDSVFSEQVDAVLSGANTTSTHIKISNTPKILRDVGLPNLPILMTAKHLKSVVQDSGTESMNYHGLGVKAIKKLPEFLADPVMIMDSLTREDSIVVLTEIADKENRPVIAAVKMNGVGRQNEEIISANILTSVYGKDNFDNFIRRNVEESAVLYWNKEKSQALSVNPGIQFPDVMASLDSDIIIRKSRAFVNSSAEKNSGNFVKASEEHNKENQDQEKRSNEEKSASDERERATAENQIGSPLYRRYQSIQNQYPNSAYFTRIGDFYEILGEKARDVAQKLNLTLTGRDMGLPERVPMAGIPFHAIDTYLDKLRETDSVVIDRENDVEYFESKQSKNAEANQERTLGEELSAKATWLKIAIPKELVGSKFGKNTLIRMPKGEYEKFGLFAKPKFLRKDAKDNWTLTVGDQMKYRINNDGRQVELNGKELKDVFEGRELGKTPQRVAPSKRKKAALDRLTQNVPDELKKLPYWGVYFTTAPKDPKKTKRDKVIISAVDGHWAKANNPSMWTDFDTAMKYALATDKEGLSLLLTKESGLTCIDLDECIDSEGQYNDVAAKLTEELKGTYAERSVSGNGLHIFVKDDILKDGKYKSTARTPSGELEVYDSAHIISLTGDMISKTNEITKCPIATTLYLRESLGERQVAKATGSASARASRGEYRPGTDNEVIDRIRKSKRGAEFEAIFSGKGLTGNASVDDMKLANILAFFTNCDEAQSLRIMRVSGSFRPDKSDDYYAHTIGKAVDTLFVRPTHDAVAGAEASRNPNRRGKD